MQRKFKVGRTTCAFTTVTQDNILGLLMKCFSRPFWVEDTKRLPQGLAACYGAKNARSGEWISGIYYELANLGSRPAWRIIAIASCEQSRGKEICSKLFSWSLQELEKESGVSAFWCGAHVEAVPFFERNGLVCVTQQYTIVLDGPPGDFRVMVKNLSR